jgi:ABC-type multidrug transport system fused ATPase/permease subunit
VQIRLDFVSVTVVFFAALFSALLKGTIDETLAGLAMVYALECCSLLSWAVRVFIETETAMTSVERLNFFAQLQPEAAVLSTSENKPDSTWPMAGGIRIQGVNMRYRPELPLVLKNLTLEVSLHSVFMCAKLP